MGCTTMGGIGSSSGKGKGGGSSIKNQLENITPLKSSQLPDLSGTARAVSEAKELRKGYGRALSRYAMSRDSNGNPVGQNIFNGLFSGTDSQRVEFIQKHAQSMTGGNQSLLNSKIADTVSLQKDLAGRWNRFKEIMNEKSADWWIRNGSSIAGGVILKNYIDGKSSKPK